MSDVPMDGENLTGIYYLVISERLGECNKKFFRKGDNFQSDWQR